MSANVVAIIGHLIPLLIYGFLISLIAIGLTFYGPVVSLRKTLNDRIEDFCFWFICVAALFVCISA